jgi:alkylated DNA repair dioxygenase AlkB
VPASSKRNLDQGDLFGAPSALPQGMRYAPDVITPGEEQTLAAEVARLPFRAFEFHGFLGRRRTVSFGWHYDHNGGGLQQAAGIPDFLVPVRERAAAFAGLDPAALVHVLVIEYSPGAGIGWHRDRPAFDDVIGISLHSPCEFRLRRKHDGRWERRSLAAQPRSAYLLRGPSRTAWEHSIPPLATLRYSITFRSLATPNAGDRRHATPRAAPLGS